MTVSDFVLNNEVAIRLSFFFGILGAMALWELLAPRRALTISKAVRWANNFALVFLNSLILRWLFPAAAVVEASIRYHLLAERRRKRIDYDNAEPIDYLVFKQRIPLTERIPEP